MAEKDHRVNGTYQRLLNATQILDDFPGKNETGNLEHARRQKAAFYNTYLCSLQRGIPYCKRRPSDDGRVRGYLFHSFQGNRPIFESILIGAGMSHCTVLVWLRIIQT